MEFKGVKRAEEYASGKSSSSVFKENHIKDYLNGYNQALEDSKYTEMVEMLKKALIIINDLDATNSDMMNELYQTKVYKNFTKHSVFCNELEQLIKQATQI